MISISETNSSLIQSLWYDRDTEELTVVLRYGDVKIHRVDFNTFNKFISSDSLGSFYLKYIKNLKQEKMADRLINVKINVDEIKKDWLFQGEKGRYLNLTIFFNDEKDKFDNNGMIVQQVPKEIKKKNPDLRGPILGNCSVYERVVDNEVKPGVESGKLIAEEAQDELPF